VTIELTAPERADADIASDRVAQVFSNLVGNARHHGVIGEPIRVSVEINDGLLRLGVSNVAAPIPDDLIGLIFDPFKQHSAGNLRNPGGMGLGLLHCERGGKGAPLRYSHDGERVVFTLGIPIRQGIKLSGGESLPVA
jgi:signal transduction histidine kinase